MFCFVSQVVLEPEDLSEQKQRERQFTPATFDQAAAPSPSICTRPHTRGGAALKPANVTA